jgi:5-hydroxyisourate hydrolase
MGRLTTHVLDTAHGCPAGGMAVTLSRVGETRVELKSMRTNADGRVDGPLLEGESFVPGQYVLSFGVAEYFRSRGVALPEPAFLDVVDLCFGLSSSEHYHVPLLVSPWSYSTYRGS